MIAELKPISIKEIDITRIIVSKYGRHNQDSLNRTIEKKAKDLNHYGYCLWAHGNLNPEHTREFCSKKNCKDIYVIMPFTVSNSTERSDTYLFKSWRSYNGKNEIPEDMEVTGGLKSNRAFYFKDLRILKENVDLKKILKYYNSINANGCNDASKTLKGSCSNKCLEIKDTKYYENVLNEFVLSEENSKVLVGKLGEPYHVELLDKIKIKEVIL